MEEESEKKIAKLQCVYFLSQTSAAFHEGLVLLLFISLLFYAFDDDSFLIFTLIDNHCCLYFILLI